MDSARAKWAPSFGRMWTKFRERLRTGLLACALLLALRFNCMSLLHVIFTYFLLMNAHMCVTARVCCVCLLRLLSCFAAFVTPALDVFGRFWWDVLELCF